MDVLDRDSAVAEFNRFAKAQRLIIEPEGLDEDDLADVMKHRARMVMGLMEGSLTINEAGLPEYEPQETDGWDDGIIKFRKHDGNALAAMDSKKAGHDVAKMFASIAACTGHDASKIRKLKGGDSKMVVAVWSLFLIA